MNNHKNNGAMKAKTCACGCGCDGCGCASWGGGWYGGQSLLRVVLGLLIVFGAFWIGVKVGEFREAYENGFGNWGMRGWDRFYGYPMMMQGVQMPLTHSGTAGAAGTSAAPSK